LLISLKVAFVPGLLEGLAPGLALEGGPLATAKLHYQIKLIRLINPSSQ